MGTCQLPPPIIGWLSRGMLNCATALAASRRGGAACKLYVRARRAALVVVGPGTVQQNCTSWGAFFFRARQWCDVPAAASNNRLAFAWHVRLHHCARCLRQGWGRSTRACCAHAPCRAACNRPMRCERALHRREASLYPRAAVVRRASCGLQELAGFRAARATARLRSLPLGMRRSMNACCARAPCRAGSNRTMHRKEHCTDVRPLSFGAWPRCDVPAAATKN